MGCVELNKKRREEEISSPREVGGENNYDCRKN